jgi:hypothetical protein
MRFGPRAVRTYAAIMIDPALSLAARASVTLTALVFAAVVHRVVFRRNLRAGALVLGAAAAVATAFSYLGPLVATLPRLFPVGIALALAAVIGSLFSGAARRAFDAASDGEVRQLLAFRAMFGALLLALSATGHLPVEFALSAGIGDLATTWLALAIPVRLDAGGPRWARLVVHGFGFADMLMVLVMAATVVRPWSLAHDNAMTAMTLPWLAVPLMFAVNAHGLRAAAGRAETLGDGSQSAGRIRSAVS